MWIDVNKTECAYVRRLLFKYCVCIHVMLVFFRATKYTMSAVCSYGTYLCVYGYLRVTDSAVNESVSRGSGGCALTWSVSLWKLCSKGTCEVIFHWQWLLLTVKCLLYNIERVSTHLLSKMSSTFYSIAPVGWSHDASCTSFTYLWWDED